MTEVFDAPEDVMMKYIQQSTEKYLFVSHTHLIESKGYEYHYRIMSLESYKTHPKMWRAISINYMDCI